MKREDHEQYEYARKRVKQKKRFYYHTILFVIGGTSMFVANTYLNIRADITWYPWAIFFWLLIWILHLVKVYLTDQYMGKDWERDQINKLVKKQEEKRKQFEDEATSENSEQQ